MQTSLGKRKQPFINSSRLDKRPNANFESPFDPDAQRKVWQSKMSKVISLEVFALKTLCLEQGF